MKRGGHCVEEVALVELPVGEHQQVVCLGATPRRLERPIADRRLVLRQQRIERPLRVGGAVAAAAELAVDHAVAPTTASPALSINARSNPPEHCRTHLLHFEGRGDEELLGHQWAPTAPTPSLGCDRREESRSLGVLTNRAVERDRLVGHIERGTSRGRKQAGDDIHANEYARAERGAWHIYGQNGCERLGYQPCLETASCAH